MARGDIDARQLDVAALKSANVCILFGNDEALVSSSASELANQIASAREIADVVRLSSAEVLSDPSLLIDFFGGVSLFNEARLLFVEGLTERHHSIIVEFLARVPDSTPDFVLLSSHSLKSRSKLLDLLRNSPTAVTASCYESGLSRTGLRSRLLAHDIELDETAIDRTLEIARAFDPSSFKMFLMKLSLASPPGEKLSEETVLSVCSPGFLDVSSEHIQAAFSPRRSALYEQFQSELANGASGSRFLIDLGRSLQTMLNRARAGGSKSSMHWRTEELYKRVSARFSDLPDRIERALAEIHRTEARLRTASTLEQAEIERLLVRVSQALSTTRS